MTVKIPLQDYENNQNKPKTSSGRDGTKGTFIYSCLEYKSNHPLVKTVWRILTKLIEGPERLLSGPSAFFSSERPRFQHCMFPRILPGVVLKSPIATR